jgi:hypothetical protein
MTRSHVLSSKLDLEFGCAIINKANAIEMLSGQQVLH